MIESLISDLAFILLLGAVVTLLFKWINQPVVLGYIVAGFLASPHFEPLPSVTTEANIEFWAQIGIVVLLFSLGLEFSFRKLLNTGGSAVVTALVIVTGMMATGFAIGHLLGFTNINSLFLGGMLSMSSTTIIIKAFTDLNLRQKKFASLVFAVLIVEDLFAVVMMVVLSSIAINNSVEGGEMLMSVSKLAFFLIIWFLVGVFILPSTLNKFRRFLNNETLLVVSMGLCLGMAVFSVFCGFSLALGAFVMGSILAGSREFINRARKNRKVLGGAMRQCGILAAAGILALTEMPAHLREDHENAAWLRQRLAKIPGVHVKEDGIQINMVFFTLDHPKELVESLPEKLLERGIKINGISAGEMRFVTNHDVTREDLAFVADCLEEILAAG